MLRPMMRDVIRAHAEIEGATSMTGLINTVIEQALDAITGLARYEECYRIETVLLIAANGVVTPPTDLQHWDEKMIYFLINGSVDLGDKYRLHPFTRMRNTTFGRASQFQLYGIGSGSSALRRIKITPFVDIDTALDRLMINYWGNLGWGSDITEFPIPRLEEVVILRTAARVCKGTNSRLASKLTSMASDAYIALRAASIPV